MNPTQVLAFFDARFCASGPVWESTGHADHWEHALNQRWTRSYQPHARTPAASGRYDLSQTEQAAMVVRAARNIGLNGFVLSLLPGNGGYVTGADMLNGHCDETFGLAFQWNNADAANDPRRLRQECQDVVAALHPWRHVRLDGRPVLIVRHPHALANPALILEMLRQEAASAGLPGLFVIANAAEQTESLSQAGFDALLDPDPAEWISCERHLAHDGFALLQTVAGKAESAGLRDSLLNYTTFISSRMNDRARRGKVFPRVLPEFCDTIDHEDGESVVLKEVKNPISHKELYGMFLRKAISVVESQFKKGERAVFIDSWNGWHHHSQIEPSVQDGGTLLAHTQDAIVWGRYLARTQMTHVKERERTMSGDLRRKISRLCDTLSHTIEAEEKHGSAVDIVAKSNLSEKTSAAKRNERRCLACGSDNAQALTHKHHWNDGGISYTLLLCRDCGWCGTHPMPTRQTLDRLYADRFDYGWYHAHRAGIYADAKRRLNEVAPFLGGSVLDYGGGHGYLALAAQRRGLDAAVYDPYCGKPEPGILDRRWDTVFCLHVLEHTPNPDEFLKGIMNLLTPGGRLILAVPNASGLGYRQFDTNWHWFQGPLIHVSHFTPTALCRLAHRCGFQLESLTFHDRWNASTLADIERRDESLPLDKEWAAARDPNIACRNIHRRFRLLHAGGERRHDDEALAEILLIARKEA